MEILFQPNMLKITQNILCELMSWLNYSFTNTKMLLSPRVERNVKVWPATPIFCIWLDKIKNKKTKKKHQLGLEINLAPINIEPN